MDLTNEIKIDRNDHGGVAEKGFRMGKTLATLDSILNKKYEPEMVIVCVAGKIGK